jgi:hypothetical protein
LCLSLLSLPLSLSFFPYFIILLPLVSLYSLLRLISSVKALLQWQIPRQVTEP